MRGGVGLALGLDPGGVVFGGGLVRGGVGLALGLDPDRVVFGLGPVLGRVGLGGGPAAARRGRRRPGRLGVDVGLLGLLGEVLVALRGLLGQVLRRPCAVTCAEYSSAAVVSWSVLVGRQRSARPRTVRVGLDVGRVLVGLASWSARGTGRPRSSCRRRTRRPWPGLGRGRVASVEVGLALSPRSVGLGLRLGDDPVGLVLRGLDLLGRAAASALRRSRRAISKSRSAVSTRSTDSAIKCGDLGRVLGHQPVALVLGQIVEAAALGGRFGGELVLLLVGGGDGALGLLVDLGAVAVGLGDPGRGTPRRPRRGGGSRRRGSRRPRPARSCGGARPRRRRPGASAAGRRRLRRGP